MNHPGSPRFITSVLDKREGGQSEEGCDGGSRVWIDMRHQAKESWEASENWGKKNCHLPHPPGPLEPM